MRLTWRWAPNTAFGAASFISAVMLAVFGGYFGGPFMESQQPLALFEKGAIGAILGFIAVAAFDLIFWAPWRVYYVLRPIEIRIDRVSQLKFVQDVVQKHTLHAHLKNRSPLESLSYVVAVKKIDGRQDFARPWEIKSGDIPTRDSVCFEVAHLFRGGAHGEKGSDIRIFNKESGTFVSSALLQIPQCGQNVCFSVRDLKSGIEKEIWYSISADLETKKIHAAHCVA